MQADRVTRTGSQLYGTALAQRFIWAHQHPKSCASTRFLLYYPYTSGEPTRSPNIIAAAPVMFGEQG